MDRRKLSLNGLIALSLLALGWLTILFTKPSITALGGMFVLSLIAATMILLTT
jgi:hypothetical protein